MQHGQKHNTQFNWLLFVWSFCVQLLCARGAENNATNERKQSSLPYSQTGLAANSKEKGWMQYEADLLMEVVGTFDRIRVRLSISSGAISDPVTYPGSLHLEGTVMRERKRIGIESRR
jgi:hypothetical protein